MNLSGIYVTVVQLWYIRKSVRIQKIRKCGKLVTQIKTYKNNQNNVHCLLQRSVESCNNSLSTSLIEYLLASSHMVFFVSLETRSFDQSRRYYQRWFTRTHVGDHQKKKCGDYKKGKFHDLKKQDKQLLNDENTMTCR